MALIKCSNCREKVSDQATAWPHCNTKFNVEESSAEAVLHENPVNPELAKKEIQQESQKIVNKYWEVLGLILGIATVIVGLIIIFSATDILPTAKFGADYYNYTYRVLVRLETAIHDATKAVGLIISVFGGCLVYKFGSKIMR